MEPVIIYGAGPRAFGLFKINRPDRPASRVKLSLVRDAGGIVVERKKGFVKVLCKRTVAESI